MSKLWAVGFWELEVTEEIARLCVKVENLSKDLDLLVAKGHARTSYALFTRLQLATAMVELQYQDLIDRCQISCRSENK